MANWVATVVSIFSLIITGFLTIVTLKFQAIVEETQLVLAESQSGVAAAQLCLDWANFVEEQQAAGRTDKQIERLGAVIFATADLTLQAALDGAPRGQQDLEDLARDADAAPPDWIVVPDVRQGVQVAVLCGSPQALRAARDTTRPVVPLGELPTATPPIPASPTPTG